MYVLKHEKTSYHKELSTSNMPVSLFSKTWAFVRFDKDTFVYNILYPWKPSAC